jgi:transcriptional regulator with XRE-family HTH domain
MGFALTSRNTYDKNMTKRPKKTSFVEEIRAAVKASGRSQRDLSRACGLAQPVISRFVSGKRGLSVKAMDAIATELGLHVVVRPLCRGL